jgi:hypothetical protein
MRTHVRAQLEEQRRAIVSATGDALLRSNERVRAIVATYLPWVAMRSWLLLLAVMQAATQSRTEAEHAHRLLAHWHTHTHTHTHTGSIRHCLPSHLYAHCRGRAVPQSTKGTIKYHTCMPAMVCTPASSASRTTLATTDWLLSTNPTSWHYSIAGPTHRACGLRCARRAAATAGGGMIKL